MTWQPATYGNVRAALRDWYDDCDKSAENITILYAAGHGVTDLRSFTRVFLKAEEDEPDPFRYSLNIELIKYALEYNYSQTKVIISDCCRVFLDSGDENGIFIKPKRGRVKQFASVQRKYDPLHIASARLGARTYALGAAEGTMLSYVLEHLLQSAGRIVNHPIRHDERYFAITQDVMTKRAWPIFRGHPKAKNIRVSGPQISGHTVDGGLHRPTPPPEFHVEFVVMDAAKTDPVDVTITNSDGCEVAAGTVSSKQKIERELPAGAYLRRGGPEADRLRR